MKGKTRSKPRSGRTNNWPLTDSGNGERLAHHRRDDFRYVMGWHKWLYWHEGRWSLLYGDKAILESSKAIARSIPDEARNGDKDLKDAAESWAVRSESLNARKSMIEAATGERVFWQNHGELDCQPMLLNCANGTLDLETFRLKTPDRRHLLTKRSPVTFRKAAIGKRWARFVEEVFPDKEVRDFVQRYAGYTLTGDTSTHGLAICVGDGANGKTTFLEVLQSMLGSEYAQPVLPSLLVGNGKEHPTQIASLFGIRMAVAMEFGSADQINEPMVKRLSGGDTLVARRMREDPWQFKPTHHIWIATNHKPTIRGQDLGIWRRLHVIPFDAVFKGKNREEGLTKYLVENELSGVLNWCLAGLREFQRIGLAPPPRVQLEVDQYRDEQDALGRFLDDMLVQKENSRVTSAQLYETYYGWLAHDSGPSIARRHFRKEVESRGYKFAKSGSIVLRGYAISEQGGWEDREANRG
ncbi:MAG: phage/plasmid primase, P4 family [Planctomycetota bacterium]